MASGGPRNFTQQAFTKGLWIAGSFFHGAGGFFPGSTTVQLGDGSQLLRTLARTGIVQHRWLGGNAPISMAPIDETFAFRVIVESDYLTFVEHEQRGRSLQMWFDLLIVDQWHIPSANAGQVLFRTSRLLPWTLPGITQTTRAPRVFLEDSAGVSVEQTIITSGSPAAGEVLVPNSGQVFGDLEVPSGLTETFLKLRYHPILLVKISGVRLLFQRANDVQFTALLQEVLSGSYTVATS